MLLIPAEHTMRAASGCPSPSFRPHLRNSLCAPVILTALASAYFKSIGQPLTTIFAVHILYKPHGSKTVTYGARSFANQAPRLLNELPESIRCIDSLSLFKKCLKTHLFNQHFKSDWAVYSRVTFLLELSYMLYCSLSLYLMYFCYFIIPVGFL